MKTKPKKTPEEIAAHEHQKRLRRLYRSLKTKVKNLCKLEGIRVAELELEFIKENPSTELPIPELDMADTIEAYKEGIELYREELKNQPA